MSTTQEMVERRSTGVMTAGAAAEGFASIGAIVLSILGLTGQIPQILLPIATIAVGASLLFEGGAVTARFSNLLSRARVPVDMSPLGMGLTTEFVSGIAGIVLGVLALIKIAPLILIPVAAIVLGSSLLLGASATARMNSAVAQMSEQREAVREVMSEAVFSAAGIQILAGIGVVVLGILALIGMSPTILSFVSMLSLGVATLLSGTVLIGRITAVSRRQHRATV